MNRRHFLMSSAAATAAQALQVGSPNDTVRVAVVGCGGRGNSHMSAWTSQPNVELAALVDVDDSHSERYIGTLQRAGKKPVKTFRDIREVLEDKNIDAVSIASPNHWHALQTIWACQAGKDVYVEKPVCHNLREGRKMVEASRKYGRMVQAGLNRRSELRNKAGVRFVQEAKFGPTYRAKAVVYRGRTSIGRVQESSIPKGVNWDLFLGPAPYRAYTLNRFHYGWHYFWDTATTEIGNNGVHAIDIVRWAMAKNVHPVKITCVGGLFAEQSDQETPNVQNATYEYGDGTLVELEVTTLPSPSFGGVQMGEFFYTPQGYVTSANRWTTVLGEFTPRTAPDPPSGVSNRLNNVSFPQIAYKPGPAIPNLEGQEVSHFQNFIDSVRSRKRENLNCEILEGHMSTSLCHLANIAFRTGRKLTFDPAAESFPGDAEANKYLTRTYREPYVVPDKV